MSEPYRIVPCPACSGPLGDQPRACELCGQSFCASCADTGTCAACLRKACKVVERVAIEQERKQPARTDASARNERVLRWIAPALAAGMFLFTFAAADAMHRMSRLAASAAAAAEATRAELSESPQRKAKRRARGNYTAPPGPPRPEVIAGPHDAQIPSMPSVLAELRPETHDPDELIARAQKLRAAGMDILMLRADLSRSLLEDGFADLRTRVTPVHKDGKTVGTRLSKLRQDSLAVLAGIQNGDIITSINGYAMASPEQALAGYQGAAHTRAAVVELIRNGRRVIVAIRWPEEGDAK